MAWGSFLKPHRGIRENHLGGRETVVADDDVTIYGSHKRPRGAGLAVRQSVLGKIIIQCGDS